MMLLEAKHKRMVEIQDLRNAEIHEVSELQTAIQQEKKDKLQRKMAERSAAWQVIKENEEEKKKKLDVKEKERLEAVKMQEDYCKLQDQQDKKRADEWEARERKIQESMNRMGDVIRKTDEAEKKQDLLILKQSLIKDKEAEQAEKKKR